ncbi:MAG: PAS domain S-box protein [Flavobacteriaceae bacterium]|nr:PAS domain S-box protein [Flavobacteriaceae bacterium]
MDHKDSKFEVSFLRRKAEELLKNDQKKPDSYLSEVEILKLIHEIEVHQIELEMQNEELKVAKERAIELASEKYAKLYDFAPSGYFTLSKEGEIIDLNIAASKTLGKERAGLIKSRLGFFVSDDTKQNFNIFLKNIFANNEKETCLVTLLTNRDLPVFVHLTGISTKNNEQCLVNMADITKLIEAENLIRDLSLIATQTDNLVIITDAKGAIEYVNNAFEKLTGYTLEEVAGKKPGNFLQGPETDPGDKVAFSRALRKREAITQEILNYTRSGEKYWVSISINPIFDNKGELEKFISIQQNITERKEGEAQREFEHQDKEALINSTNDLIWSIKNDFTLIAGNKTFLNSLKLTTNYDFKKGDNILETNLFTENIDFWQQQYQKTLRGESFKLEMEMNENPKSGPIFFETNFNPIYVNAEVVGVACFARNITEYKKNKEALIEYNKKLQTAQEIAKLGYWEFNLKTRKLFWSDEVYVIWEKDKEKFDLTLESFIATIHPEDRPGFSELLNDVWKGKKHIEIKYRILLKNGSLKWIHESGNLIKIGKDQPNHYEGTVQDITSQKQYESQILDANQRLRSLTAHLQTIQEEERINIAREIHDELGQQLTGIKLDASWLKNKTKIYLEDEKERMDRLINNINTTINNVRKIATNLRPGVLDDLGLEAAIEWQAAQFEEQTGISSLFKTSNVSDNYDETVNTAVYRIFQEALTNVTRHANASKVIIELYEKNSILVLEVADNGKGIWETEKNKTESLGITGMKERAYMINGTFSIKKRKEGGTIVRQSVPL